MNEQELLKRIDKVIYANYIIRTFAQGFKRSVPEIVKYLDKYGGLQFLLDNYEYEHTQSEYNTHMALLEVCRNNGGWL
ncbi:MAG: DUF3791 domain-containing protein [Treponema sp.]|nr:DUF3791 domain-containing protein [Treponema sp.]